MVLVGSKTWVALGGRAKRCDTSLGACRQERVGGLNERGGERNLSWELNFFAFVPEKNE